MTIETPTLPVIPEDAFSPEQLELLDELITERLADAVFWAQVDITGTMQFLTVKKPVYRAAEEAAADEV